MMKATLFCLVFVFGATISTAEAQVSLSGAWEGVIDAPKRPLVVATDFSSSTVKLDATGTSSWLVF